jgi:cell division ATPase FtsA
MVRVEETAAVPVMVTALGERLQVGASTTLAGVVETAQERFTLPVRPPDGVAEIVDVPVLPVAAPRLMVILPLLLSVKVTGTGTVTTTEDVPVAEV